MKGNERNGTHRKGIKGKEEYGRERKGKEGI